MKKKGYTLVELMISIGAFSLMLGVISMVIISSSKSYVEGMDEEITGNAIQTYYAYIIEDLTPEDLSSEENSLEVSKEGSSNSEFTSEMVFKRSWKTGTPYVKYSYEDGDVFREYYTEEGGSGTKQRILSTNNDSNIEGINVRVLTNKFDKNDSKENLLATIGYEDIELDFSNNKKYSIDSKNYANYYIEPRVTINGTTYKRGQSIRFIADQGDKKVEVGSSEPYFNSAVQMTFPTISSLKFTKIIFKPNAYIKENPTNQIFGRIADKDNNNKSCRITNGDSDVEEKCITTHFRAKELDLEEYGKYEDKSEGEIELGKNESRTLAGDLSSYKKITLGKGSKLTLQSGLHVYEKIDVGKDAEILVEDGARVKLYIGSGGLKALNGSQINATGTPDQLLLVSKGGNIQIKTNGSVMKAFIYSVGGDVDINEHTELHGGLVNDGKVEIGNHAFIQYHPCGAKTILEEHITEPENMEW